SSRPESTGSALLFFYIPSTFSSRIPFGFNFFPRRYRFIFFFRLFFILCLILHWFRPRRLFFFWWLSFLFSFGRLCFCRTFGNLCYILPYELRLFRSGGSLLLRWSFFFWRIFCIRCFLLYFRTLFLLEGFFVGNSLLV